MSSDPAEDWPADAVEVARVLGAWGLKGAIRVKAFAADPQALFASKRWYLRPPSPPPGAATPLARPRPAAARGGGGQTLALPSLLRIVQAREQGDAVVATVRDVDDRDAAEALRGARVFVARASFPTPDADEFYWVDLIGCAVVDRAGVALGTVAGLIETGPHCVLRVAAADGAPEELVPFVAAYVDTVDLPARRIVVDWTPGG